MDSCDNVISELLNKNIEETIKMMRYDSLEEINMIGEVDDDHTLNVTEVGDDSDNQQCLKPKKRTREEDEKECEQVGRKRKKKRRIR